MAAFITLTDPAGRVIVRRPATAAEVVLARRSGRIAGAGRAPAPPPVRSSRSDGVTADISAAAYAAYARSADRARPASSGVRAVFDRDARLREVAARSSDGFCIRINFTVESAR